MTVVSDLADASAAVPPVAPARRVRAAGPGGRELWKSLLIQWSIVGLLIAAWAAVSGTGAVPKSLLPPVGATASELLKLFTTSKGLHNLGVTGLELLGAFAISTPVAIVLGFWLGEVKQRHAAVGTTADNVLATVLSTPKFIFLPVLVVILGASYWEKVVYALGDGLIIVIIGSAAASYTAERQARRLSAALGMNKWEFFWKIYLPGALPVLVEALRLSVILTMSGVLLAELYISSAGIGYLIFQWGTQFNLPALFAGVILVAIVAIVINTAFRIGEARMSRWRS